MKPPAKPKFDPAVPLTWPLRWHFYQQWGHEADGIRDPFWWSVTRNIPSFSDSELVIAYRLGTHKPEERIACGYARTMEDAKRAIEAALYEANLALERYYLMPRIDVSNYTCGTASSFSGFHVPTPGGRP